MTRLHVVLGVAALVAACLAVAALPCASALSSATSASASAGGGDKVEAPLLRADDFYSYMERVVKREKEARGWYLPTKAAGLAAAAAVGPSMLEERSRRSSSRQLRAHTMHEQHEAALRRIAERRRQKAEQDQHHQRQRSPREGALLEAGAAPEFSRCRMLINHWMGMCVFKRQEGGPPGGGQNVGQNPAVKPTTGTAAATSSPKFSSAREGDSKASHSKTSGSPPAHGGKSDAKLDSGVACGPTGCKRA